MINLYLVIALSYLVGSFPTAIIVSKWIHGFDIRSKGSGNAGGTNVFRVLGWKWGLLVTSIDIVKAVIATTVVAHLFWDSALPFTNVTPFEDFTVVQILCGSAAVLGHIFTIFANFKGGKGVAPAAGMLIGITPVDFGICAGIFFLVVLLTKYVSLGSLLASVSFPVSLIVRKNVFGADILGYGTLIYFAIGIALLILYAHRTNIKRLIQGTENKLRFSHAKK